ncbi:hypothetical protein [Amedibacterium intestinale]|jgi:hypothetical protein|uniref:hypothetical protein n=1 Tax=Amedibacterium intestinale TaxID=2583452 RepID=UPI000E49ACBD|nr:hypothetical protein [Amedibacterium intestinale]RHO34351.1 hypothetical protein DW208_01140 [Erysipelotrichaceae bacterium AM17-60]
MDRRIAEALFVQLENCVIPKYREECSMIIDTFMEEEFSEGEFKRLIAYLIKRVQEERRAEILKKIETKVGEIELPD